LMGSEKCTTKQNLSETACLTLPLHQRQDITLPNRALNVADNGAIGVIEEFDADLGHVARVARAAQDLVYPCKLDWLVL